MAVNIEFGNINPFDCTGNPTSVGPRWRRWKCSLEFFLEAKDITKDAQKQTLLLHYAGQDDFSKGFDLVDHNILIQEMELLGVHEATIRWIGSFLTDRSQRVRIGQVYSHPVTPNGGIPQGTKLAPLLFAILVNNLCRDWRYRIKYVDDTSVFESIPRCSPSYLPFIAANINTYASMRNMRRLNEKKCKDMVINPLS